MGARSLRQVLAPLGAVLEQIRDPKFGRDLEALGHLEALDQSLQDELRRIIVRGHVVPLLKNSRSSSTEAQW